MDVCTTYIAISFPVKILCQLTPQSQWQMIVDDDIVVENEYVFK